MSNTTPIENQQPTRSDSDSGRLVLDTGGDDYLDLRSSQEANPGAISLSRGTAERYRDTFMRSDTQLLEDQAELQKKRDELQAIRNKLDGLDAQMAQLQQSSEEKQKYFLYGLAGLLTLGCLGWLISRRNTVTQKTVDGSGVFDSTENHTPPVEQMAMHEQDEQAAFDVGEGRVGAFDGEGVAGFDAAADIENKEEVLEEVDATFESKYLNEDTNVELPSFEQNIEKEPLSESIDAGVLDLGIEEADEEKTVGNMVEPSGTQHIAQEIEGEGEVSESADESVDITMTSLARLSENDAAPVDIETETLTATEKVHSIEPQPVEPQPVEPQPVEPQPAEPPASSVAVETNSNGSVDISFSTLGALPVVNAVANSVPSEKEEFVHQNIERDEATDSIDALRQKPSTSTSVPENDVDIEIKEKLGASEADEVVISDGMTPEEVDIRLSRLGSLPTSADSATPTEASTSTPVVLAGAADLPSDVQQQIRVEQLLRTLAGETDDNAAPPASAVPPPVSVAPSAARPEADAVKDGNLYEPFNPVDIKPTSLNMKESEADRMLAEEESVFRTQDSSVLMQLDMPSTGSKKPQSPDLLFESDTSDNSDSAFDGVETDDGGESIFAVEDDAEAITATSDSEQQQGASHSADMPLTMYEEMVELEQSNTAFRYDDFGFDEDKPKPEQQHGQEQIVSNETDGVAGGASVGLGDGSVDLQIEEVATFEKPIPWYKKLFSRKNKAAQQPQNQLQQTDDGNSGLPSFLNVDDGVEDDGEVNAEKRLAQVWQDSNDWMPDSEPAVPDNVVYDEIDLVPNMQELGDLRSRPSTGESLLGFLRHLYKQVTALKQAGEASRARSLLLEHLMIMPATSAWVYLEYLSLSDSSSDDALVVSSKFKEQFNRFPPVDRVKITGMNVRPKVFLEYEQALHSLCNVWGEERACDLLDKWLTGYASNMRLFSLHAYRELFLLYDVLDAVLEVTTAPQSVDKKTNQATVDIDLF